MQEFDATGEEFREEFGKKNLYVYSPVWDSQGYCREDEALYTGSHGSPQNLAPDETPPHYPRISADRMIQLFDPYLIPDFFCLIRN